MNDLSKFNFNFCPVCGTKLQLKYPGNDPEVGPRESTCVYVDCALYQSGVVHAVTDHLRLTDKEVLQQMKESYQWAASFPDVADGEMMLTEAEIGKQVAKDNAIMKAIEAVLTLM